MARNKYPEETVARILDVSLELFDAKGYDNVTIQDIVDNLGGLTKGAIYHHFRNKSEIFDAALDRRRKESTLFADIFTDKTLTGLQRLRRFLACYLSGFHGQPACRMTGSPAGNSIIIAKEIKDAIHVMAPDIKRIIDEGNADGSLQVSHPQQAAETTVLLLHLWLNPTVIPVNAEVFKKKVLFVKETLESLGIPLIDEDALCAFDEAYIRATTEERPVAGY